MITFGENNAEIARRLRTKRNGVPIMHKYCISWISFFDNELHMDFVYATSTKHALTQAYERLLDEKWDDEDRDLDIKQAAFDMDGMIDAIQVD